MRRGIRRDSKFSATLIRRIVKSPALAAFVTAALWGLVAAGCARGFPRMESRPAAARLEKNNSAARADVAPPVFNNIYFTDMGRQLVEPSARIALGRVRSISQLPAGPVVARVEVEKWIRTPDESFIQFIAVSAPGGMLERGDDAVLLFLAPFETSYSSLHPMLAVAHGVRENLDARIAWIEKDLEIAAMAAPAERIAATRERLVSALASKVTFTKNAALRDCSRLVEGGEPVFQPEDASRIAAIATRLEDREQSLRLLDLAARIRAKAR